MRRLKAIAKKAGKKAAQKVVTRLTPKAAPPPPAKEEKKKKKEKTMSDQIDDLARQVDELTEENDELKAKVAELERNNAALGALPGPGQTKEWTRGKLPGDKLIKTNNETGEFEEIEREEWDSLA